MRAMRAKMRLSAVDRKFEGQETLTFSAITTKGHDENGLDDDNTYAKYTPSASLTVTVTNPALLGKFEAGQVFYVDFTEVPSA